MNTSIYSVDELLSYLHNGTIAFLESKDVLRIVEGLDKRYDELEKEFREYKEEQNFFEGYGYALNAVERAVKKLKGEV